jgi:hypothetical protein
MCGTKCCCGWTKYTGFEGDNDPTVVMNTAEANVADPSGRSDGAKIPGKCVAGNSKRPFDMKDANNNERDIAYYYYLFLTRELDRFVWCMNGAIMFGFIYYMMS